MFALSSVLFGCIRNSSLQMQLMHFSLSQFFRAEKDLAHEATGENGDAGVE